MNTQQQYIAEMQSRYQRLMAAAAAAAEPPKQSERKKKKEKKPKEAVEMSMGSYVRPTFRPFNIIIDSAHRDTDLFPQCNDFVVRLVENLRNVAAVRILKTEFYQSSNSPGFMVFNDIQIPLQSNSVEHAYLYLNGMINTAIANDTNIPLFGRVGPGTEMYPSIAANPLDDPFVYVMRPIEPKMRKFHVRLLQPDGTLYPVEDARIIIVLAVYCLL